MTFVLDASTILTIVFDEDDAAQVSTLLGAIDSGPLVVPAIWPAEIANVLVTGERRKRIGGEEVADFLQWLSSLPIETDVEGTLAALDLALPLARRFSLTAYDALYLELALRKNLPVATLDKKLAAAAGKLAIPLLLS